MNPSDPGDLAIEVRGLVKRFGELTAVAGLDLTARRGECVGLLGPNGAGKTTTLEILEGIQQPTEGTVRVLGMGWDTHAHEIRSRTGLALQETDFYGKSTVRETLELFRSFYPRGLEIEEAVALVRLEEKLDAFVAHLSGGQAHRLALAVALVSDPELVFLDEPTTGLDPQSRRAIWDIIEDLKARGRTVLLTTHYMDEAERLSDRVVVVDHGKVIAEGTPRELITRHGGADILEFVSQPALDEAQLKGMPGFINVQRRGNELAVAVSQANLSLPWLLEQTSRQGAVLERLSTRRSTLEDVFLVLTGRALRESKEKS